MPEPGSEAQGASVPKRLARLTRELHELQERLRLGGGKERIEREHSRGKLTARERIAHLFDPGAPFLEVGLLIAHDRYEGEAPAAGVVTGIGTVHGRQVVVVANDATVKAGAWWPETVTKILRAQEIAMRCKVPIVYLVDSAGVNLPYQGGVFPGQYGASRIFYYNSIMRRYLAVPQIAAVMGPCIAGGAYLPALSDFLLMVEGTSFMGLGGPNLVRGATGEVTDEESLGGARTHNAISGVAHYRVPDDRACIAKIRRLIGDLPQSTTARTTRKAQPPDRPARDLYQLIPPDHRQPYEMREVLRCLLDRGDFEEFQAEFAPEVICAHAHLDGIPVGVIANARGMLKGSPQRPVRFGGILYAESAEKMAYFIETLARQGTPLLFLQDVSGFMVGLEAEHSGIIRAGARLVEAMATAAVPKIVLTLNHASGAGYYAMAGQGFDPDFIFTWPTGRMGVMEGESAVMALFSRQLERSREQGGAPDLEVQRKIEQVRADYELQLDARYAAARGFVDAILTPEETRGALALALRTSLNNPGPHLGAFVLPQHLP